MPKRIQRALVTAAVLVAACSQAVAVDQHNLPRPTQDLLQLYPGSRAPGSDGVFTFTITAPATAGTYNSQWRMAQDGVGLFGDLTPNVAVVVSSPGGVVAPLVLVTEVRTVAADRLWLSPSFGRDSVAIHFTWKPEPDAVAEMLGLVEARLAPFDPRPHWGKLTTIPPEVIRQRYPERRRFADLARRLDPGGTFRNPFVDGILDD